MSGLAPKPMRKPNVIRRRGEGMSTAFIGVLTSLTATPLGALALISAVTVSMVHMTADLGSSPLLTFAREYKTAGTATSIMDWIIANEVKFVAIIAFLPALYVTSAEERPLVIGAVIVGVMFGPKFDALHYIVMAIFAVLFFIPRFRAYRAYVILALVFVYWYGFFNTSHPPNTGFFAKSGVNATTSRSGRR